MQLKTLLLASLLCLNCVVQAAAGNERVDAVLQKVASHSFHPLNDDHSVTNDCKAGKMGLQTSTIRTGDYDLWHQAADDRLDCYVRT